MASASDSLQFYQGPPPSFGHDVRKYFQFTHTNLNCGSYGTVPCPVQSGVDELTAWIESSQDHFRTFGQEDLLLDARCTLARFVGAEVDEVVIVPNTSTGINVVLRNFEWEKGDTIVSFNTSYRMISNALQHLAEQFPYIVLSQVDLQFPMTRTEILAVFKNHILKLSRSNNVKIVVIMDSIISTPGVLLPWKEMVKICKDAGIWSIVDAAHSLGQEPDINLKEVQPDFWMANCYKWFFGKCPSGVLYVPIRNQEMIKSSIPTSGFYVPPQARAKASPDRFASQFQWNGGMDMAAYGSIPHAFKFRAWLGGEEAISAYCHNLAMKGGKRLAGLLRTRVMDDTGELTCNMTNVELPIPASFESMCTTITQKLLKEHDISCMVFPHNGCVWVRCCVNVFSELEEFEKLGKVLLDMCPKVVKEYSSR